MSYLIGEVAFSILMAGYVLLPARAVLLSAIVLHLLVYLVLEAEAFPFPFPLQSAISHEIASSSPSGTLRSQTSYILKILSSKCIPIR